MNWSTTPHDIDWVSHSLYANTIRLVHVIVSLNGVDVYAFFLVYAL